MPDLNPAPSTLGLHSPAIGPWFSDEAIRLPLPDEDLALPLDLGNDLRWLPPAAGFLSFFVRTATPPLPIAHLRGPRGPAFGEGRLVAIYEMLPQASERLAFLMREAIPTLGEPATAGQPTRPPVHSFAIEFTADVSALSFFNSRLSFSFPPGVDSDAQRLAYLGLSSGSPLGNGERPMRDLFRPGLEGSTGPFLLRFPSTTSVRLWSFDRRGRAIDPGAVACWWRRLEGEFPNLRAPGATRVAQPIAADADRLIVQLVNAHEGPLAEADLARVTVGGNVAGTGALRHRGTQDTGGVDLSFSGAPTAPSPDDLPLPRMAVLPDGRLSESLTLFADGPVQALLTRDHVRVAVLSLERHLTGQARHAADTDPEPVRTRAADQHRESTRILVERSARPGLLRTGSAVAAEALAALRLQDGGAPLSSGMVAPAVGLDWGPAEGELAEVDVPASLSLSAQALVGGGTSSGGTVADQRVLLTVELGAAAAGAWVRGWSQGFDVEKGERFRMDGAAGRANADGRVRLVLPLPDGAVALPLASGAPPAPPDGASSQPTPLGVDLMVVTARGRRLFADQRFTRPAPLGGVPASATSATGPFLLCEEGREVAALDANAAVRPGTQIVALGGPSPTLVDRLSVPATSWAPDTLLRAATAALTLRLSPPALKGATRGDPDSAFATTGATLRRSARTLPNAWQAGQPLPGQDRRELVVAATSAAASRAVIGGGPALPDRAGRPPHKDGHPLCPAGPDVVGVGLRVEGPAVRGIAEFVRERTSEHTVDLVQQVAAADLATPTDPAENSLWIAGLRTVAAGVEAEVGLAELTGLLAGSGYPFGQGLDAIRSALSGLNIPAGVNDTAGRIARALDRRFLAASRGAREGATALLDAVQRAEDFIYMESPAIDDRELGGTDDKIHLVQAIVARLAERPGLRVVLCLPVFFDANLPRAFQRIRDAEARAAIDALTTAFGEARFAVFSPSAGPARTLTLATTTVIVDDAFLLTGTTHLWRRGLSYDGSYAATVFDDQMEAGRPAEILRFRRSLLADRLGLAERELPEDPKELVEALQALIARGGLGRLASDRLRPPLPEASTAGAAFTEFDVWNPDGSPSGVLSLLAAGMGLLPGAASEAWATP